MALAARAPKALAAQPSPLLAQCLLYSHVVAYFTGRTQDTRAKLWTVGSLILIFITERTLLAALGVCRLC